MSSKAPMFNLDDFDDQMLDIDDIDPQMFHIDGLDTHYWFRVTSFLQRYKNNITVASKLVQLNHYLEKKIQDNPHYFLQYPDILLNETYLFIFLLPHIKNNVAPSLILLTSIQHLTFLTNNLLPLHLYDISFICSQFLVLSCPLATPLILADDPNWAVAYGKTLEDYSHAKLNYSKHLSTFSNALTEYFGFNGIFISILNVIYETPNFGSLKLVLSFFNLCIDSFSSEYLKTIREEIKTKIPQHDDRFFEIDGIVICPTFIKLGLYEFAAIISSKL